MIELRNDYRLIRGSLHGEVSEIIKYYFDQLEKDIKNDQLDKTGLTGYLIAVSEFYNIFLDKEKWMEYSYKIIEDIREMIYGGYVKNIGLFDGLTNIAFAVKVANKKMNCYNSFSNSLDALAIEAIDINLNYLEKNINEVKVVDYDLVNGISGAGMYLLFLGDQLNAIHIQKRIINYFIKLTNDVTYGVYNIPRWFIKGKNQLREQDMIDFSEGSIDFGMAHGMLAPLLYLSKTYKLGIIVDGQLEAINKIIDIYFKFIKIDKNNIYQWPSQLGINEFANRIIIDDIRKYREGWCYGSMVTSRVLYLVGKNIDESYLQEKFCENIIKIANLKNKDYLIESPIVCHGYSGLLEMLLQTYNDTSSQSIKPKIISLIEVLVQLFNSNFKYGYKNRGIEFKNGVAIVREIEFYDILNGATGIILSLYSAIEKNTLWQNQLCIS